MASIIAVRELADSLGVSINLLDNQIESIARQCGDFDAEKVLVALKIIEPDKLNARTILAAIRKHQHAKKVEYCGYCHDGWIPILETKAWAQMERPVFTNTILVPQAMTPCPNCSMRKGDALKVLESQEPDAQGWSFALLFNFIRYTLGRSDIKPDQFTPSQYWPSLVWEPPLSFAQMELMEWISAPRSVPMPRLPANHRMAAVARNVQLRMEA